MSRYSRRFLVAFFGVFVGTIAFIKNGDADIRSTDPNDPYRIEVSKEGSSVTFELCRDEETSCRQLGVRAYTVEEIQWARRKLYLGGSSLAVGELAVAYALGWIFYTGSALSAAAVGGARGVTAVQRARAIGRFAGVVSLGGMLYFLNPIRRFNEAGHIRGEVVMDRPVYIHGSVKDFAAVLDRILRRLK